MNRMILTVAGLVIGAMLASGCSQSRTSVRSSVTQTDQARPSASPAARPTPWQDFTNLLFADQTLDEFVSHDNAPNPLFTSAYKYVKEGRPEAAKKSLKQVLADPDAELRTKLWAWRSLRQLGEKPPANIANEVQGLVLEVAVENGVDTLAAYSGGSARYVNALGGAIVWEVPGENRISALITNAINAAKPLVEKSPVFDKHQPTKNDVLRVSILTYGGIHVVEAKQSDITEKHIMSPVYEAGTQLFLALLEENEKSQ
jgi:hypothetical protein